MRVKLRYFFVVFFLFAAVVPRAFAQNPDAMMPEQSAAKAKQLLQQLIDALGGQNYLGIRESECEGRFARFARTGELGGYVGLHNFWQYPDRNLAEIEVKSGRALSMFLGDVVPDKTNKITELYAGNQGWILDRNGVSEEPAESISNFQGQVQRNIDNLLRLRLKEAGMFFRYGGSGIVDLKQVEWVELADRDQLTFRLAIDHSTHLLLRSIVVTRDETTRETSEEITFYSNYQPREGVMTPLQLTRERDGRRIFQAFFTICSYNQNLPADFFTKAGLEKRYAESVGKKNNSKNKDSN